MRTPQPIPYQGSKRALAPTILSYFPEGIDRLIEPFAGSAAISIAAALNKKANRIVINDINSALIRLLDDITNQPEIISLNYATLWNEQLGNERQYFLRARELFNKTQRSDLFLYILARCVKGAIRYNSQGEFNQSADNRRKGKTPENMRSEIRLVSNYLRGKTEFHSRDYSEILELSTPRDLVYMDPPYQGTCKSRDPRYFSGILFQTFVENLERLNVRGIPYIISYDGKTGDKTYGNDLPGHLNLHKITIEVGRSSQATLLGKDDLTFESLYLSEALVDKLAGELPTTISLKSNQLELTTNE